MAAKDKYETHVRPKLILIAGWMRNGLTLDDVAHNLGISPVTLFKYRDAHVEFSEALKSGKEVADIIVENALYKRAVGYAYDEVTYQNGEEVKRVTKEALPDVTAQIFWLKNRKPVEWRDKQEIEHKGRMEVDHSADQAFLDRVATEHPELIDLLFRQPD